MVVGNYIFNIVQNLQTIFDVPDDQDEYPSPVQYQNTGDPTSLAEEVSSGSVYVQQDQGLNDELYYIYYQGY